MSNPQIFIFSGPGGAGKTTLVDKLLKKKEIKKSYIRSISCTTRSPRPGEKDGRDYFFIGKSQFLRLKKKGFFLESEKVLNDYYGTPKQFYSLAKKKRKDLILCIDVKGGMYLKKNFKPAKITAIFIGAPSAQDLQKRMKKRVDKKGMIQKRIQLAKKEMQFQKRYDYLVINQNLKEAINSLECILRSEKMRRR